MVTRATKGRTDKLGLKFLFGRRLASERNLVGDSVGDGLARVCVAHHARGTLHFTCGETGWKQAALAVGAPRDAIGLAEWCAATGQFRLPDWATTWKGKDD